MKVLRSVKEIIYFFICKVCCIRLDRISDILVVMLYLDIVY